KAILAILLRRYEFQLAGDPVASDFHGLVIGPKEPCRVSYRLRKEVVIAKNGTNGHTATATATATATGCPFHAAIEVNEARSFKVVVDRDLCQGHAACVGEAPEVFKIGADGKVELRNGQPTTADLVEKARAAAKFCPTRTIKV